MAFDAAAFLTSAPTLPGVYQMFDQKDRLIYVGKAKNLKKRLSSYFSKKITHRKTEVLVAQVAAIKVVITSTENEALLLEANLIKLHRPRYNVLLRDDKSYPYLFISTEQDFPRIDFYRGARQKHGKLFGPYPSSTSVRQSIALVQKLFKVRPCKDSFFNHRSRPCLQYQIHRCTAPCVGLVSQTDYQKQIQHAILFLEGKNETVLKELQHNMQEAAFNHQYELAATFRDQIAQLRQLQATQSMDVEKIQVDVIGIARKSGKTCISVMFVRGGRVLGQRIFYPSVPEELTDAEALMEFIPQYYLEPLHEMVRLNRLIVTVSLPEKIWLQSFLKEKFGAGFLLIDKKISRYRDWQAMVSMNAEQTLQVHLNEKQEAEEKLLELQKVLSLSEAIMRIECFDISHTLGESTVASCVVYTQEGAQNKAYRRFHIKNAGASDDYAALKEAILRRYTRLQEEGAAMPEVVLIDGGKGQLKQAVEVMEALQLPNIVLLSMAKGVARKPGLETIFIWQDNQIKICHIEPHSAAFHVLQFVRDEAHRFAITQHRQLRAKKRQHSILEDIPGIGAKRRKQLLDYFGGMQELKKASIEQLMRVEGISLELAERICRYLQGDTA